MMQKHQFQKITQIEIQAQDLEKVGRVFDAVNVYEEVLELKEFILGKTHPESKETKRKLCELYNYISLKTIDSNDLDTCFFFLKKGLELSKDKDQQDFYAVALNNVACYYRKIEKPRIALTYANKAYDIEFKLGKETNLADTCSNLCALYSSLDQHEIALEKGLMSIFFAQSSLLDAAIQKQISEIDPKTIPFDFLQQRCCRLAISFFNLATSLEHLLRYEEALTTYRNCADVAGGFVGKNHSLFGQFRDTYNVAKNEIEYKSKMKEKTQIRRRKRLIKGEVKETKHNIVMLNNKTNLKKYKMMTDRSNSQRIKSAGRPMTAGGQTIQSDGHLTENGGASGKHANMQLNVGPGKNYVVKTRPHTTQSKVSLKLPLQLGSVKKNEFENKTMANYGSTGNLANNNNNNNNWDELITSRSDESNQIKLL